MARLTAGITTTPSFRQRVDPLTDLSLLLSRLQRTILHGDAEREARLRSSEFERAKAQANINYARSLLTKLEQEALAVKIHARRQDVQADLVRKREVIDQLTERLGDLAEIAAITSNHNGDDGDDTSEGEDILADIIATPSESMDSTRSPDLAPQQPDADGDQIPDNVEPPPPPSQPEEAPATKPAIPSTTTATTISPSLEPTTTSQTLRPRQTVPPSNQPTATTTAISTSTTTSSISANATTTGSNSSALFGNHSASEVAATSVSTTEAILDHQRAEQDALSESILRLAEQLKASSQAFSASLEEDKELVNRAGEGMSRAGESMQRVSQRMGALQRMVEGEGWFGRMRLYVIIYGLMVVLVLVVGVMPKLRF
ncbi:hypothetical protein N656DRAFT_747714 [Canariomyces notabilis]|uniref:Synaptobrevin n=1 Tax=Canariomyces notabilis TaxID=2074819 RepID=A0AAN6YW07_9PEZI|nr:hypothetical protein N656DRAFT_747714 [Canariomyces arenarius]